MLVHFTLIKVNPEKAQEASNILGGSKLLEYFLRARGIHHGSLSESVEEPGKLLSLSMWDSLEDAQAVFTDPNYGALIAELRNLLVAAPVRIGHTLLYRHFCHELPVDKNLFVHNTIVTVAPENTARLIEILYQDKVVELTKSVDGFIMSYAFESLEEPGRIVSMSWWDSAETAAATFTIPEYSGLLADMRHLFIKAPERQGFRLMRIVRHDK